MAEPAPTSFGWPGLLREAGIPTGAAAMLTLGFLGAQQLLRRFFDNNREEDAGNRAERQQLSSEQAAFRQSLLEQIKDLHEKLEDAQHALDGAVARHLDAERRIVEFQLTIARLAAVLISSGITIPPSAIPDLGLTQFPRGPESRPG